MKPNILFDGLFIIIVAGILIALSESGVQIKIPWLFIPFLISYYLGRYVSGHLLKKDSD